MCVWVCMQARNPLRGVKRSGVGRPAAATVVAVRAMATTPVKVGVLMGSPNDLPKMKGAVEVLRQFGLEPDVKVTHAHSLNACWLSLLSVGVDGSPC